MTDPLSAAPSDGPPTDLTTRYGRTGRGRRPLLLALIGVLAVGGLAWLLWVASVQSTPTVASRLRTFDVTSPTSANATVEIERTDDVEATCRLQAKAEDFSIVGETTLTVPADGPRRQAVTTTLSTQRLATAVVLIGCTTPDSQRAR